MGETDHVFLCYSFRKSLRYMRANNLTPEDAKRLTEKKQALAAERNQINAALTSEDIDPEIVRKIIDCVETVQQAETEKIEPTAKMRPEVKPAVKAAVKTVEKNPVAGERKKGSVYADLQQARAEAGARNAERSRKKSESHLEER